MRPCVLPGTAAAFCTGCTQYNRLALCQTPSCSGPRKLSARCRRDTLLLLCVRSVRSGGGGEAALAARALALLAVTLGAGDASERWNPVRKRSTAAIMKLQMSGVLVVAAHTSAVYLARFRQVVSRAVPAAALGAGNGPQKLVAMGFPKARIWEAGKAAPTNASLLLSCLDPADGLTSSSCACTQSATPGHLARRGCYQERWQMQTSRLQSRAPRQSSAAFSGGARVL